MNYERTETFANKVMKETLKIDNSWCTVDLDANKSAVLIHILQANLAIQLYPNAFYINRATVN